MATNSLVNVNIDRLAEQSLAYLASNGIRLNDFSLNLSGGVKDRGETVKTRLAASLSTQDMSSTKATGNSTLSAVDVTLNQYHGVVIGFNDLERSYTDRALDEEFVAPAIEALQEKIVTDILAHFSADTCANAAKILSTNKVPHPGRIAILSPALIESLVTDGAIQNAAAFGDNTAVTEGKVPKVHGFGIKEYTGSIPANAQNMVGLFVHPQAFAIAAREIAEPEPGTWFGQVRSIVDPISGLPIQIRKYYNGTEQVVEWSILYGVAKGQVAAASRIVTA
jgi:hypothetical protein